MSTCPDCHHDHRGSVLCPECGCWYETPLPWGRPGGHEQPEVADPTAASVLGLFESSWRCTCGRLNDGIDRLCPACGDPALSPGPATSAGPATARLELTLPSGAVLLLGPGESVQLGREVGPPAVREAFAAFPGVSRRHLTVTMTATGVSIRDEGSRNGTWVGGREVRDEVQLTPGELDRIRLGQYAVVHVRRAPEP